jgi:1-acyl-sn-glycerol-3-phosphate acyltransferase
MQRILIEKPYRFVPPYRGTWWARLIQRSQLVEYWLRTRHGIVERTCRGIHHLQHSIHQGHGILLTPNHCRPADALVMGQVAREAGCLVYVMASWHLFEQTFWSAWAIRRMGAFSVYREGVDRQAIQTSIEILASAERPLIIFPEGTVTRTNDRLQALLEGVSFIARAAAAKRTRQQPAGQVVVHPVALRYLFQGDLESALDPLLADIERRLTWRPRRELPLLDRITKLGLTLLGLKEIEYFGSTQNEPFPDRLRKLIDRLLGPLEAKWLGQPLQGPVVPRVKALRMKIMPDLVRGDLEATERDRRWRQLEDIYLAQQISSYPADYLDARPSVDRILETAERLEEDLTDQVRVLGPIRVIIQIGPAITVEGHRDRTAASDPLISRLETDLQTMLDELRHESPIWSARHLPAGRHTGSSS